MIGIVMFFTALFMLILGFPVAFTFAAVSVFFGIAAGYIEIFSYAEEGSAFIDLFQEGWIEGISMFEFMPYRIFSIQQIQCLFSWELFYKKLDLQKNFWNLWDSYLERLEVGLPFLQS